jgi:hypothetical protein
VKSFCGLETCNLVTATTMNVCNPTKMHLFRVLDSYEDDHRIESYFSLSLLLLEFVNTLQILLLLLLLLLSVGVIRYL